MSEEYIRGFNDALVQAARVVTENYQQCITYNEVAIINLTIKVNDIKKIKTSQNGCKGDNPPD